MFGAIIGDLAGSTYEYDEYTLKTIDVQKRLEILSKKSIISHNSFYSDDTILTIAILNSILNDIPYADNLKKYGLEYFDKITGPKDNYFKYMFSPGFIKWCNFKEEGNSIGNGAMMRISSVGYLFDSLEEVLNQTLLATTPTHNSKEAISAAQTVATVIFYARSGLSKDEIQKLVFPNPQYTVDELIKTNTFNSTCQILDSCLTVLFESIGFEDSIKKAVAIGGDTDTAACIVGSMAEAIYGVPEELCVIACEKLPEEFVRDLNRGCQRIKRL